MIIKDYNPSPLEIDLANALFELKDELSAKLNGSEVLKIEKHEDQDNPDVRIRTKDSDGDVHEFTLRIIQTPDSRVSP